MRKCYHIYVEGLGKVHIPGCWPGAIHGESHCSCYPPKEPTEKQLDKKMIRQLEKENAALWRIIRKLKIDGIKV